MISFLIGLVTGIIILIIRIAVIGIISILAHEFGHYMAAKIYGANPRFRWYGSNPAVTHDRITHKWKSISVNLAGMLTGILSIILLRQYIGSTEMFIVLIIGMIMASNHDIANVIYKIKDKDDKKG